MIKLYLKKKIQVLKLKNCFSIAGLYYKTVRNGQNIYQFPKILDVKQTENKTRFVFRLPHGVDPNEVKKKEFVFKSMFGDLIEMKGTNKVVLTVYENVKNKDFTYSFEDWEKVMKKHKLPIIAGMDRNGRLYSYDMTENPHLLIAGETGSGKSTMLRAIITSLIQHMRTGLRIHLCDLKRSEFFLFRGVDIVDSVLNDRDNIKKCVNWFHKQLQHRGELLDSYEVSHIDKFNELEGVDKQDYLLLCIDEFSLLRHEKETMEQLLDIASIGRALGIYLILSTQRPDRNIIDGLMKANLTVRYAFRHADKVNSRITLGEGAKVDASEIDESDRGKFFMRYNGIHLLQAPYLGEEQAKELLEWYKSPITKKRNYGHSEASEKVFDDIANLEVFDIE